MEAIMEKPLLDQNVHEIDFSSLDAAKELRKISPRFMEELDRLKGDHKVFHLRAYPVNSPVEEALIQAMLDKFDQPKLSTTEESKVRRAMAEEASKGIEIDSPDKEAEWEAKMQEARLKDKAYLDSLKGKRAGGLGEIVAPLGTGEGLSAIKNLGDKSVEKLHAAGVKTVEAFHALSNNQLKEIVGPVVAAKFVS